MKVSSRQRKSYRRSVLHKAALTAPSLPPPKNGTLRQAALASVQRLQAVAALAVITQSAKKRPLPDSPSAPSPSNLAPLAQRIRKDIKVGESEVESPEKEILRSPPCPENPPSPISPCVRGFPSAAPLVFTPCKIQEVAENPASNVKLPPSAAEGSVIKCLNCDGLMGALHQCETVVRNPSRIIKNLQKFCSVCETFYKAGTKCQSCRNREPPT